MKDKTMTELILTRLQIIAELANQHQSTEELLQAIWDRYPDMTVDRIQTALRRAGDIYNREADRLQANKQDTFLDDFLP